MKRRKTSGDDIKKGFYCHKSRDRGLRIPDCQDNTTQEP